MRVKTIRIGTHIATFDVLSNGRIQTGIDGWLLGVYDTQERAETEAAEYVRLLEA
jgi:hypothetical protein